MQKFVLDVVYDEKNNAGSKAKSDVSSVLTEQMGFSKVQAHEFKSVADKLRGLKMVHEVTRQVHSGDTILIQYPTYFGHFWEQQLFKKLRQHQVKIIILLHDLDVLRQDNLPKYKNIEWVTNLLNLANVIIVPNDEMGHLLKQHGLVIPQINLGIYDYLQPALSKPRNEETTPCVSFAGNLNKSTFLHNLPESPAYQLYLYGMLDGDNSFKQRNIHYQGIFPPDVLKDELPEGYGLVWDGSSSNNLGGMAGNYLRYNNPHKTSLYLSSGLPVIVPQAAAVADFVNKNHVGITISGLNEIAAKISEVTSEQRYQMQLNAIQIGKQLRAGKYTRAAVAKALNMIK